MDELTCDELVALIQTLSPKYRMVFNLYAIEGYNHQEISETLGISVGTSKSNLSRARVILQLRSRRGTNREGEEDSSFAAEKGRRDTSLVPVNRGGGLLEKGVQGAGVSIGGDQASIGMGLRFVSSVDTVTMDVGLSVV